MAAVPIQGSGRRTTGDGDKEKKYLGTLSYKLDYEFDKNNV
jgi:hypothetical protein